MDDNRIIELYFARDERAIEETRHKYGRLLLSVALRMLKDRGESEECENDTYVKAWESIPPTRPTYFSAYLTRIIRNLALNRIRDNGRHNPDMNKIIWEISELTGEGELTDRLALREAIGEFVGGLDQMRRRIFLKRYFYMQPVREIAYEMGLSVGTVKSHLYRMRRSLGDHLLRRGISI